MKCSLVFFALTLSVVILVYACGADSTASKSSSGLPAGSPMGQPLETTSQMSAVTINPGPSRPYDQGVSPASAINNEGFALEVNKSEDHKDLWYSLFRVEGTRMTMLEHNRYIQPGENPAVDINDNGFILEVHQDKLFVADRVHYKLGRIDGSTVTWLDNQDLDNQVYDDAVTPSVALNNNGWFVEVHQSQNDTDLFYNVGRLDQTTNAITWFAHANKYDEGHTPSIALNDDGWVVEVHREHDWPLIFNELHYCLGRLDQDTGTITWFAQEQYDTGIHPSVSLDQEGTVIEVHQSQSYDTLWYKLGKLGETSIAWTAFSDKNYDTGHDPSVAINDRGKFFEVHKSEHTIELWYHLGGVRDYTNWMSDLMDIENAGLRNLTLPGTHDSGAYWLDDIIAPTKEGHDAWDNICDFVYGPITGYIAYDTGIVMGHRFGKTQNLNIYDQLNRGIRFIDLRVTYFIDDFFTHHGLLGEPVSQIFLDIRNFMENDAGSKEVVLLLVDAKHENTPDYTGSVDCDDEIDIHQTMSPEHHDELIYLIEDYLGEYLYPRGDENIALADLEIGEIAEDGPKIILIYPNDNGDADFLWRESDTTHTLWADEDSLEDLKQDQQPYITSHYQPLFHHDDPEHIPSNPRPCDETLLELQWTLTAQPDVITKATECYLWNERWECDDCIPPFCNPACGFLLLEGKNCQPAAPYGSVHDLSEMVNPYLDDFMYKPDQKNIDIVRVDFFEESNAVEIAIDKSLSTGLSIEITDIDGNQEGLDQDLFENESFFNDSDITVSFRVSSGSGDCSLTIDDIFPSHGAVTSFESTDEGVYEGEVVIDPHLLVGTVDFVITATDSCDNSSEASASFEVVLKVPEGNVVIKPESLRVNPGKFTSFVVLPDPYDALTITDAEADGAPHQRINLNPSGHEAIIKFDRADIEDGLLDTHFIVTGHFEHNGEVCWFQGSDDIMKVE